MFLKRIRRSISERARYFAKCDRIQRICEDNEVPIGQWDLELLQTVLSIRAIAGDVPSTLIDVGAHRGRFTQAAVAVLGTRQAVCVEPDSDLLPEIAANNPGLKLQIANVALGETRGDSTFYVHDDRSMNSTVPADSRILKESFATYQIDNINVRHVPQLLLDDLLAKYGLDDGRRLFMKLDTQGSELNILRSGPRAVAQTEVCLVEFMFCTPYATTFSFSDLISFMTNQGLRCEGALEIKRRKNHRVSGVDFLFVRSL